MCTAFFRKIKNPQIQNQPGLECMYTVAYRPTSNTVHRTVHEEPDICAEMHRTIILYTLDFVIKRT